MFGQKRLRFTYMAISFVSKSNPKDQARAPHGRIWHRACEGLKQGCVAKGKRAGTGGKLVKMIVAISYNKRKKYDKTCGAFFETFIDENFEFMFQAVEKGESGMLLMDGGPSQNSARAREAMKTVSDSRKIARSKRLRKCV